MIAVLEQAVVPQVVAEGWAVFAQAVGVNMLVLVAVLMGAPRAVAAGPAGRSARKNVPGQSAACRSFHNIGLRVGS